MIWIIIVIIVVAAFLLIRSKAQEQAENEVIQDGGLTTLFSMFHQILYQNNFTVHQDRGISIEYRRIEDPFCYISITIRKCLSFEHPYELLVEKFYNHVKVSTNTRVLVRPSDDVLSYTALLLREIRLVNISINNVQKESVIAIPSNNVNEPKLDHEDKCRKGTARSSQESTKKLLSGFFNGDKLLKEYGFSRITSSDKLIQYSKVSDMIDSVTISVTNSGDHLGVDVEKSSYPSSNNESLFFTIKKVNTFDESILCTIKSNLERLFLELNLDEAGNFKSKEVLLAEEKSARKKLISDFHFGNIILEKWNFKQDLGKNKTDLVYIKEYNNKSDADVVTVIVQSNNKPFGREELKIEVVKFLRSETSPNVTSKSFTVYTPNAAKETYSKELEKQIQHIFLKLRLDLNGNIKFKEVLEAEDEAVRQQLTLDFNSGILVLQKCNFKPVSSAETTDLIYNKKYDDGSVITITVVNPDPIFNLNRIIQIDITWKSHDHSLYPPIVMSDYLEFFDSTIQFEYITELHTVLSNLGIEDSDLTLLRAKYRFGDSNSELINFIDMILQEKCGFSMNSEKNHSYIKKLSPEDVINLDIEIHDSEFKTFLYKKLSYKPNEARDKIDFTLDRSDIEDRYIHELDIGLFQIGLDDKAEPMDDVDYSNRLFFYLDT